MRRQLGKTKAVSPIDAYTSKPVNASAHERLHKDLREDDLEKASSTPTFGSLTMRLGKHKASNVFKALGWGLKRNS